MKINCNEDVLRSFLTVWGFDDEYVIYGTSTTAHSLLDKLGDRLKVVAFLDGNSKMLGQIVEGRPVILLEDWKQDYRDCRIIVASGAYTEIKELLQNEGLQEQKDFCDSRYLIGAYFAVTYNQVYLYRTDITITECCNLRCSKCNMLMPYFKEPKHVAMEQLKSDIDTYFEWVDNLQILNILGGEPFIYPHVEEITRYICEHYGDRIEQVIFFTNGLVRLTESMLTLIKEFNIILQISDYRIGIPQAADRVDEFMKVLERENITFRRNYDNQWLDFGFPDYVNETITDDELIEFFDGCYSPFRGIFDKKLYYCHLNTSAVRAGLFEDDPNDYFDMSQYDEARKRELVMFDLGYTQKGYITYCRRCKGCFAVNEEYTSVAAQLPRM